jgi:hypothetical protein
MTAIAPIETGPAKTIDEVIGQLDEIIARAIREESRLGFFPALYRKVTLKVKEGIETNRFQDGPRMEKLDVNFANRYLGALATYQSGGKPAACWLVSFGAAKSWRPIVLQHLLLGMNAHINFDLGIAAAVTCPGDELPPLKHDFDEINKILAGLVNQVEDEINEVSPWIDFLDHIDPSLDDRIINFSMDRARAQAWKVAVSFASIPQDEWSAPMDELDRKIASLGNKVADPGNPILSIGLLLIRARESNNVRHVIEVLNRTSTKGV